MNFKGKVTACEFSPCGKSFAVLVGKLVQIWATPTMLKEFAPFRLLRTYGGMYDDATCLAWSGDSQWIIVGGKDLTARIYSANHLDGYAPPTLSGHREPLVAVAFCAQLDGFSCYTISEDGALFEWQLLDDEDEDEADANGSNKSKRRKKGEAAAAAAKKKPKGRRWRLRGKHFFHMPNKLSCARYHARSGMLCAGFAHGVFTLHRLATGEFNHLQTLSISTQKVTSCEWNETGEWIALGCAKLGQLLVWEWQSETYVYKQQGHYYDVNACAYSPDGALIATASDDNTVKVWSAATGSCFVTFDEHSGPVGAVCFLPSGHAVLSASMDGTVRAFDLMRYRNFKTLTSPDPCQFVSLAVDPSGEIVCAGARARNAPETFLRWIFSLGFVFVFRFLDSDSTRRRARMGQDDCYEIQC